VDKSKMAKAGTKIEFDLFKEDYGQDQMSRPVKQRCLNHCYDEGCDCKEGLDDVLNPSKDDCCCISVCR
jgi:hypothetical protein